MISWHHRKLMRLVMAAFYGAAGVLHVMSPTGFLLIVPPWVPWPQSVVWLTGLAEIAGAIALFVPKLRHAAGLGLAAYAICVFPANIYHAVYMVPVAGLPNSWWYHGPRFLAQPVLVWWALYCSEVINWPFRLKRFQ